MDAMRWEGWFVAIDGTEMSTLVDGVGRARGEEGEGRESRSAAALRQTPGERTFDRQALAEPKEVGSTILLLCRCSLLRHLVLRRLLLLLLIILHTHNRSAPSPPPPSRTHTSSSSSSSSYSSSSSSYSSSSSSSPSSSSSYCSSTAAPLALAAVVAGVAWPV